MSKNEKKPKKTQEPPKPISSPASEKHVSLGKKTSKKKAVKSTSRSKQRGINQKLS